MARVGEPIVLATYDVSVRAASRAKHVFAYGSGDAVTLTVQGDGVHVFNVRPISILEPLQMTWLIGSVFGIAFDCSYGCVVLAWAV